MIPATCLWGEGLPAWLQWVLVPAVIALAWGLGFSGRPSLSHVPSPRAGEEAGSKFIYQKEFPMRGSVTRRRGGKEIRRIKILITTAHPSQLPEEAGDTVFIYSSHQTHSFLPSNIFSDEKQGQEGAPHQHLSDFYISIPRRHPSWFSWASIFILPTFGVN